MNLDDMYETAELFSDADFQIFLSTAGFCWT